jgi:hypothetical protein
MVDFVIANAHLLASDSISVPLLFAGIPACAFLASYSAVCWRNRIHLVAYLVASVIGIAVVLAGVGVSSYIASIAADHASVQDFDKTPGQALALSALLWPLGFSIVAGMAALLVRRCRSLFGALATGWLASGLTFVNFASLLFSLPVGAGPLNGIVYALAATGILLTPYFPFLVEGKYRLLAFVICLAAALVTTVLALRVSSEK